jgi:hypothetical protein
LLLSSACATLLSELDSRMTAFTHRGLSPHQFTPMSGAHKATGATSRPACPLDAGWQFGCPSCAPPLPSAAVAQFCR